MKFICENCGKLFSGLAYQRETGHWNRPGTTPTLEFCGKECAQQWERRVFGNVAGVKQEA